MKTIQTITILVILAGFSGCIMENEVTPGPTSQPAETDTQPAEAPPDAPGSSVRDIAATVDETGPDVLTWLGAAGVPVVGAFAVVWRKRKIATEIVATVQAGLDVLEGVTSRGPDGKFVNAKAIMLAELRKQTKGTARFVKKAKKTIRPSID